jgi:hypothetical protein
MASTSNKAISVPTKVKLPLWAKSPLMVRETLDMTEGRKQKHLVEEKR